jgi:hypothetical protein
MGADRAEPSVERLRAAIDALEAAAEGRIGGEARRSDAEEELAIMQDDRARLAVELDAALAGHRALVAANTAAAERVAKARAAVEAMLARAGE